MLWQALQGLDRHPAGGAARQRTGEFDHGRRGPLEHVKVGTQGQTRDLADPAGGKTPITTTEDDINALVAATSALDYQINRRELVQDNLKRKARSASSRSSKCLSAPRIW